MRDQFDDKIEDRAMQRPPERTQHRVRDDQRQTCAHGQNWSWLSETEERITARTRAER